MKERIALVKLDVLPAMNTTGSRSIVSYYFMYSIASKIWQLVLIGRLLVLSAELYFIQIVDAAWQMPWNGCIRLIFFLTRNHHLPFLFSSSSSIEIVIIPLPFPLLSPQPVDISSHFFSYLDIRYNALLFL